MMRAMKLKQVLKKLSFNKNQERIYLDHAAATPLLPKVASLMCRIEQENFANASSIHREGVEAGRLLASARAKLARSLQIRTNDITFTGSGTESNNLAIVGTIFARQQAGLAYTEMEVITTAIEHPSVLETMKFLERLGVLVHYVPIKENGLVDRTALTQLLSSRTVLVSLAYVNSEVGVIQPVAAVGRLIRAFAKEQQTKIIFHTDAAQAPLWLNCELEPLQVDILTLDAGKCGGPKGVGIVARRHGVPLAPVLFGGPQESGLRPATENVVGIVGAVEAVVLVQENYQERSSKVRALRDQFIADLTAFKGVVVNGDLVERVANNVNISIPGLDSEFAVICLDEAGVAASTKSACSGAGGGLSAVVMAMTGDAARAHSTIRFTLGPDTTEAELKRTVRVLEGHIAKSLTF